MRSFLDGMYKASGLAAASEIADEIGTAAFIQTGTCSSRSNRNVKRTRSNALSVSISVPYPSMCWLI